MSDSEFLGPNLTPPRGGLQRLQQAIDGQAHRQLHLRSWIAAGVTASLIALSLAVVLRNAVQQHRLNVTVNQALTAAPQTQFKNGAYQELPSNNPNVKILLVGSLPQQPAQTADSKPLAD